MTNGQAIDLTDKARVIMSLSVVLMLISFVGFVVRRDADYEHRLCMLEAQKLSRVTFHLWVREFRSRVGQDLQPRIPLVKDIEEAE